MTIQQYRKLKTPIEKLVKQITDYSTEKGIDISSPQFELNIERAISNFLGEQGFKYEDYIARKTEDNSIKSAIDEGQVVKNAEMVSFIGTTEGLIKDIKSTKEEVVKVVNQTVSQAKQFVESLDREPIKWDRVTNKPKIITDKEVKGMIDKGISDIPQGETGDEIATRAVKMALEEAKKIMPEIEDIANELPQLGSQIRDGLELLEGEERLDISAIKGLDDYSEVSRLAREPRMGGGSTARNFYQLFDVPQSYTGQGGKVVAVKADVSGLEFIAATDTDEKVKYDAADTSAGYLGAKTVAGTGITLSEGTGGDADKLKITNSAPDQTVAITGTGIATVTGTYPNFNVDVPNPFLIDPVDDWWDPTGGLPVAPEVGDRYGSDGTAGGWIEGYIYEWTGTEWIETSPLEGMMFWMIADLIFWVFFSGGWMEVGESTFLKLDQTVPQAFTAGTVAGSGLLKVTAGVLGLDTSTYLTAITAHASTHAVGGADAVFPTDPGADKYLKWNNTSNLIEWADVAGGGDMLLGTEQTVTALKTFDKDKIAMKGTSTGTNIISVANTSATSYTNTLPAKDGTFAMTSDIPSALLLDQTTPQTIINGFPLYEDGHGAFTSQHNLVDKEYVDNAVSNIGASFFMLDAADGDIAAYKQTSLTASALATASVSASVDAETDTLIEEWVSPSTMIFGTLNMGVYDLNVFAAKTAGNRAVRVFWRFYERLASDGSEVLIATSNLSELVTTKARLRIYATLSADYVPTAGSRLVGKVYFNTVGGSQNTTTVLYYQGDEDSHWEIPVNSEFLDANYVTVSQTVGQTIGLTGARLTKLWATDIDCTNAIAASITGTAAKATNLVGGNNTTLLGSIPYQSNTDTTTLLAPNTTTTKKFLRETGDGTNGTAPAWDTLVDGDLPATIKGLTLAPQTVGFTIAGGTTSKTLTVALDASVSGTNTGDQNLSGYAPLATPVFTSKITMGVAAGTTGSAEFIGTTSGVVTLTVGAEAGTWTMTLPANDGDSGQVLSTNGSGVTSWVAAGVGTPTAITVANEATDTTCFPLFVTAATGDLGPKTVASFTLNSNTGAVGVGSLASAGVITGTTINGTIITASTQLISDGTSDTPASCPLIDLRRSRDGDPTDDVSDNDYLGEIRFRGYKTDAYYEGAIIRAVVNGTPGAGDMPAELIFATSADGSATPTTRLTIDAAGLSTFANGIAGTYLTASEILITDADKKIVSAPVATYPSLTELSYVKGLSSAIQTQLGDKAPLASPTFTGTVTTPAIKITTGAGLGKVLTSDADGDATWETATSGGITWSAITDDATMTVDTGSLANKGTLLTLTLPATCVVGKTIRVAGMNAGLWKIAQAANQYIKFGNLATTTGTDGSLASTLAYDAVELVCIVADTGFTVVSSLGSITIV